MYMNLYGCMYDVRVAMMFADSVLSVVVHIPCIRGVVVVYPLH